MGSMVKKGQTGDVKSSEFLLESKFPEEFGKKRSQNSDDNTLEELLMIIQSGEDAAPLVADTANKTIAVRKRTIKGSAPVKNLKPGLIQGMAKKKDKALEELKAHLRSRS